MTVASVSSGPTCVGTKSWLEDPVSPVPAARSIWSPKAGLPKESASSYEGSAGTGCVGAISALIGGGTGLPDVSFASAILFHIGGVHSGGVNGRRGGAEGGCSGVGGDGIVTMGRGMPPG
jgi:hypothetical protein